MYNLAEILLNFKSACQDSIIFKHHFSEFWHALLKFSKISAKLYSLLYRMSPDHILKWWDGPQLCDIGYFQFRMIENYYTLPVSARLSVVLHYDSSSTYSLNLHHQKPTLVLPSVILCKNKIKNIHIKIASNSNIQRTPPQNLDTLKLELL